VTATPSAVAPTNRRAAMLPIGMIGPAWTSRHIRSKGRARPREDEQSKTSGSEYRCPVADVLDPAFGAPDNPVEHTSTSSSATAATISGEYRVNDRCCRDCSATVSRPREAMQR
jgi:hypothetical protein